MLEKYKKMKEISDDKLENVGGGAKLEEDGTWSARLVSVNYLPGGQHDLCVRWEKGFETKEKAEEFEKSGIRK